MRRGRSYPITVTTFSHIDRETKSQRDSPVQSHAVRGLLAKQGLANEDKVFSEDRSDFIVIRNVFGTSTD
jgi:hypothetical protein